MIQNKQQFLNYLKVFKNVEQNYRQIISLYTGDNQFCYFMNCVLEGNNKILLTKFNYFIGGFLKALDITENKLNYGLKESFKLYRVCSLSYDDLIIFKDNINKIISFKGFTSTNPSTLPFNSVNKFSNKYQVIFIINYEYKDNCEIDCFDISELSVYYAEKEYLFRLFTFFKVINVEINEEEKKAEIILNSIGRKKNMEQILSNSRNTNIIKFNNNILEIN